jgi:hypothetical protein
MFSTTISDPRKIVESQASPNESAEMYSKEQLKEIEEAAYSIKPELRALFEADSKRLDRSLQQSSLSILEEPRTECRPFSKRVSRL